MCHVLIGQSILGKVCRPPRRQRTDSCGWAVRVATEQLDQAVWQLRSVGIAPCRVETDAE